MDQTPTRTLLLAGRVLYTVPPTAVERIRDIPRLQTKVKYLEWLQPIAAGSPGTLLMRVFAPDHIPLRALINSPLVYRVNVFRSRSGNEYVEFRREVPAPPPTEKFVLLYDATKSTSNKLVRIKGTKAAIALIPNNAVIPSAELKPFPIPLGKEVTTGPADTTRPLPQQQSVPTTLPSNVIPLRR